MAAVPAGLPDLRHAVTADFPSIVDSSHGGEDVLAAQLHAARRILATHPDTVPDGPTGLDARFEALRWFPLPPSCLTP